jgi:hypothetical protein
LRTKPKRWRASGWPADLQHRDGLNSAFDYPQRHCQAFVPGQQCCAATESGESLGYERPGFFLCKRERQFIYR